MALATTVELQLNTTFDDVFKSSLGVATQFYAFWDWGETWQNLSTDFATVINSAGGGVRLLITEWNVEYPNTDRFTAPLYMASIAALQGWDAPMLFDYSHGPLQPGGGIGKFIVNPAKDSSACFKCHLETQAEFHFPQHHPVIEGKMNCVQCHGHALVGVQHIPRLAGQQYEYLRTQLRGFKAQTRADLDGNMTSAAQPLTEKDIDVLADYLAGLGP